MDWHVQHRAGAIEHVDLHPSAEAAIAAACHLIDAGHEVHGIGTGPLTDSIGAEEIARIYALWGEAVIARRRHAARPGY